MKTYKLSDTRDMISLARLIQSYVYWNYRFSTDEEDGISFRDFWDMIESDETISEVIIDDTRAVIEVRVVHSSQIR